MFKGSLRDADVRTLRRDATPNRYAASAAVADGAIGSLAPASGRKPARSVDLPARQENRTAAAPVSAVVRALQSIGGQPAVKGARPPATT